MIMSNRKYMVIACLFIGILVISIVYSAFSTTFTVSVSAKPIAVTHSCSCAVTATGFSGAAAPSGSCSPTGESYGTQGINFTLHQPGDKVTCTITVRNRTGSGAVGGASEGFTAKVSARTLCSKTGDASSPIVITDSGIAVGTVLNYSSTLTYNIVGSFYSQTAQGNPTTKTASVTCSTTWVQA